MSDFGLGASTILRKCIVSHPVFMYSTEYCISTLAQIPQAIFAGWTRLQGLTSQSQAPMTVDMDQPTPESAAEEHCKEGRNASVLNILNILNKSVNGCFSINKTWLRVLVNHSFC